MATALSPHRYRLLACALLAALATAACGAESGSVAPDDETADATETETGAGATETEPSESPTEAGPTAADGTDYSACDDGSCEVAISEAVTFEFDDFTLTIAPTEDGIETEKTSADGGTGTSGSSGAYCLNYITADSHSGSCYAFAEETPAPPDPEPGVLALELLGVADGTAVIRLTMG